MESSTGRSSRRRPRMHGTPQPYSPSCPGAPGPGRPRQRPDWLTRRSAGHPRHENCTEGEWTPTRFTGPAAGAGGGASEGRPMVDIKIHRDTSWFERFAHLSTVWTGSTWAFILALLTIVVWAVTGPIFAFSDTWQLVINTGTTVVTFLMVFLIQRSQNKESLAVQLKLNEVLAALKGASNRLVNVEDLTEEELRALHEHYSTLARLAKEETDLRGAHSVEEAQERHRTKV